MRSYALSCGLFYATLCGFVRWYVKLCGNVRTCPNMCEHVQTCSAMCEHELVARLAARLAARSLFARCSLAFPSLLCDCSVTGLSLVVGCLVTAHNSLATGLVLGSLLVRCSLHCSLNALLLPALPGGVFVVALSQFARGFASSLFSSLL